MRHTLICLSLCLTLAAAGCGAQDLLLGAERGYLFTAFDTLALPGEEVPVRARLQGGDFLRDKEGVTVRFHRGGDLFAAAETDAEGVARVTFTPPSPGNYVFTAEVAPIGLEDLPPRPTEVLVACRPADAPMMVVDLDKTLVASGFETVLAGDPEPMPHSPEVMDRLAERYSVVYLTHRPEYFGPKSKSWLEDHGYPRGPMLLSTVRGFLKGSRDFKTAMIADLKKRFTAIQVGVGDKIGDALAYHDNGLASYLIPPIPEGPKDLEERAKKIDALPEAIQVVTSWKDVERGITSGARFPPSAVAAELRARAAEARSSNR